MKKAFVTGYDLLKIKNKLSYPDFDLTVHGGNLDFSNAIDLSRKSAYEERVFVVRARNSSLEIEDDIHEGSVLFDYELRKITEDYDSDLNESVCDVLFEEIIKHISSSKTAYIYKITNLKNKMVYIGKSISNPATRWAAHISGRENSKISKAIESEGLDNFEFKIVEVIAIPPNLSTQREVDALVFSVERKWIISEDSINKGYNARM